MGDLSLLWSLGRRRASGFYKQAAPLALNAPNSPAVSQVTALHNLSRHENRCHWSLRLTCVSPLAVRSLGHPVFQT
jgi:hypothetical protein